MTPRKTIKVADVRAIANHMLEASEPHLREGRISVALLLERILMETDNYKGFGYADDDRGHTDDTRRHYYG